MMINYENLLKYYFKNNWPGLFNLREKYKRKNYQRKVKKIILEHLSQFRAAGSYPLFRTIEIETMNRCNSTCSFCPVNKNADTRAFKKMDEQLFIAIVKQLKRCNYSGRVGLYSNNEPFLDERISDFAKIAKTNLPQCTIFLYTNGTLLTPEKFVTIMQHLDQMYIDNYNDRLKLIRPVKEIYDFSKNKKLYNDRVRIRLRRLNDVLSTRGGQAPNRKEECNTALDYGCLRPFYQMVVRPDGKVSLCCNDALGKMTLGDLAASSVEEVWQNEMYVTLREKLVAGRTATPLCRACDSML
ncbi:SPASM domain-containing protein|uniref:Radical SAM additional 4Fe4S-binding SPASM domain-containing protein n=1 Tax=Dendrosporobacter quercicolus TaxID=146817 RepID=A0A1H0ASR8_9FIRM|nr:radical SAM/SPASM domain-containing protein [Dendrosporobacter quercicolus]NSL48731.1 SPASM domain-containing protein [Dendrosporobacter quercicolus DSM 1736]SDN36365.1 radical SAM additional 4Fe4S-binding SPASM domain-containing protein [Dendrosporobacter quercicolus]